MSGQLFYTLLISLSFISSLGAQVEKPVTQTETIVQDTLVPAPLKIQQIEKHVFKGNSSVPISKSTTVYDTNNIMTLQEVFIFAKVDTGNAVKSKFTNRYNPRTRLGEQTTTSELNTFLPKQKARVQTTRYKSLSHGVQRLWLKRYKVNSKSIKKETSYDYNAKNQLVEATVTQHFKDYSTTSIDKFERNHLGKKTYWEATDNEDGSVSKAREHRWFYLADSLLIKEEGYLYTNWMSNVFKYKKGKLAKGLRQTGTRAPNGKVKITGKVKEKYKDGKLQKRINYYLGKKERTSTFAYSTNKVVESVKTKDKQYEVVEKWTYQDSTKLPLTYSKISDGKEIILESFTYNKNFQKVKVVKVLTKTTGTKHKTILLYNEEEQLQRKELWVDAEKTRVELYQYKYYPQ
jgi:hypothetical protein